MTSTINRLIGLATVVGLIVFAFVLLSNKTFGSAPVGLPTSVATTSQFTVTTTQQRALATSTCDARIVTTTTGAVMLSFTDLQGFVPTPILGHLQLASTTVVYDSGQYGCGAMRVISATGATSVVIISETK